MAKPSVKAEFNTFVAGLVTEASPLNFPPNASADEQNFVLNRDGTRNRRLGLSIENIEEPLGLTIAETASKVTAFEWVNPGGIPNLKLLVIRTDSSLQFYNAETSPLVDGLVQSVSITGYPIDGDYTFTSVNGILIVACGDSNIAYLTYNDLASPKIALDFFRVKTRDVWGVQAFIEPRYETDDRFNGSTFDECHIYNLQNQSWGIQRKDKTGALIDPSYGYEAVYGKYPSNSEVVWTALQYQPVTGGADPYERMYYNLYADAAGAVGKAPKGYFIIDAVDRGASRTAEVNANGLRNPYVIGLTPIWPQDRTTGGPTVVKEFAGRVFFAGFPGSVIEPDSRSPNLSNYVFFSQLVKSNKDIGACYQEGDPTSRDESDVVETDGGFVRVSGCDKINGMVNLGANLIIFATNGVWSLSGGSDYGFSATNYKLDKISNFGCISTTSIVEERGRAFYWAETGIYVVARNQLGDYEVAPLTDTTISSFYQSIPNTSKTAAKGVYDPITKKISWVYSTGELFTDSYDSYELVFDLNLSAFSKLKVANLPADYVSVLAPFISSPFRVSLVENEVLSEVDTVIVGSDDVVVTTENRLSDFQSLKFVVGVRNPLDGFIKLYVAAYTNQSFVDWAEVYPGGADAFAYLLTGAMTAGDSTVNKTIPYLTMHFGRTETIVDEGGNPLNASSCKMRCQWGWTNDIQSGRWSALQEVYRYVPIPAVPAPGDAYTNHSDVVTTKNKIRGYGKAISIYLETSPGKDCQILGWGINLSGNSYV